MIVFGFSHIPFSTDLVPFTDITFYLKFVLLSLMMGLSGCGLHRYEKDEGLLEQKYFQLDIFEVFMCHDEISTP